ncbi:MAG: hypothetical protein ACR2RE_31220, partial [Geminicoccaceae bacterium]
DRAEPWMSANFEFVPVAEARGENEATIGEEFIAPPVRHLAPAAAGIVETEESMRICSCNEFEVVRDD